MIKLRLSLFKSTVSQLDWIPFWNSSELELDWTAPQILVYSNCNSLVKLDFEFLSSRSKTNWNSNFGRYSNSNWNRIGIGLDEARPKRLDWTCIDSNILTACNYFCLERFSLKRLSLRASILWPRKRFARRLGGYGTNYGWCHVIGN